MERKCVYETPLNSRYASPEMQRLFSPDHRYGLWRRLWVALAETEMELGLNITKGQIDQMKAHLDDIDYEAVRCHEEKTRHDVMAHVLAYGEMCPDAAGIIHLGATSCYVTDNADALILLDATKLIREKVVEVLRRLKDFALEYKDMPALGLTHLQPAQLVTVGKRATLWMQDLTMDVADIDHVLGTIKLLGSKGTTGTQASFMELFDGDGRKCVEAERRIAQKMGLERVFSVSGQTYPRKMDSRVLSANAGVAQSAYKFAQDMRLLQAFHELEEPFGKDQIGSSAMAYKRNPMRSERMCSLARHVMALTQDADMTAATQWFERTLDDSANKRIAVAEAFLGVDAILNIMMNVCDGLVVYPKV
ncbi:MAG: adenylosuccinate lyase, partial [Clostridia bacterium]